MRGVQGFTSNRDTEIESQILSAASLGTGFRFLKEYFMEAIQTEYKGYKFRSRLEARWAVFFDALKIDWDYEREGYSLGDGLYYLPDFWVPCPNFHPSGGYFVEIKPTATLSREETNKVDLLSKFGHTVYVLCGDPMNFLKIEFNRSGSVITTQFDGRGMHPCIAFAHGQNKYWPDDSLLFATKKARQARFEHGC